MTGQSVGFGASPLSCFLFRPRKSCEKRRKRSHTNVFNALVTRTSTPPAQTAHVRFRSRKRVHTRLSEKDRTQRLARRNRGRFGWGWYHYSRSVPHVHKHPRAGYQNGVLCRFWALVEGNLEERREPAEQRCAHARRCSEASRPRWAAWSVCNLVMLLLFHSVRSTF